MCVCVCVFLSISYRLLVTQNKIRNTCAQKLPFTTLLI